MKGWLKILTDRIEELTSDTDEPVAVAEIEPELPMPRTGWVFYSGHDKPVRVYVFKTPQFGGSNWMLITANGQANPHYESEENVDMPSFVHPSRGQALLATLEAYYVEYKNLHDRHVKWEQDERESLAKRIFDIESMT